MVRTELSQNVHLLGMWHLWNFVNDVLFVQKKFSQFHSHCVYINEIPMKLVNLVVLVHTPKIWLLNCIMCIKIQHKYRKYKWTCPVVSKLPKKFDSVGDYLKEIGIML